MHIDPAEMIFGTGDKLINNRTGARATFVRYLPGSPEYVAEIRWSSGLVNGSYLLRPGSLDLFTFQDGNPARLKARKEFPLRERQVWLTTEDVLQAGDELVVGGRLVVCRLGDVFHPGGEVSENLLDSAPRGFFIRQADVGPGQRLVWQPRHSFGIGTIVREGGFDGSFVAVETDIGNWGFYEILTVCEGPDHFIVGPLLRVNGNSAVVSEPASLTKPKSRKQRNETVRPIGRKFDFDV